MNDAVFKGGRRRGFTTVYREVAQDRRLSLKARGLFLLLQSLPETWQYTISGLATLAGTGKDQIRSGLAELLKVGYLVKEQAHDEGGKFAGNIFVLQEEAPLSENPTTVYEQTVPLSGNPIPEKPMTGKPSTENPTLIDKYNNKKINKTPKAPKGGRRSRRTHKETADWKPERFEAFWTYYRTYVRNEDRQAAIRAWDKLRPDDALIARIGRALEIQIKSPEWIKGVGKPYASTYLNNARWEDVEGLPPPPPNQPPPSKEVYGWQQ